MEYLQFPRKISHKTVIIGMVLFDSFCYIVVMLINISTQLSILSQWKAARETNYWSGTTDWLSYGTYADIYVIIQIANFNKNFRINQRLSVLFGIYLLLAVPVALLALKSYLKRFVILYDRQCVLGQWPKYWESTVVLIR